MCSCCIIHVTMLHSAASWWLLVSAVVVFVSFHEPSLYFVVGWYLVVVLSWLCLLCLLVLCLYHHLYIHCVGFYLFFLCVCTWICCIYFHGVHTHTCSLPLLCVIMCCVIISTCIPIGLLRLMEASICLCEWTFH